MYIKGSLHTYREYNYNTVAPQLVHFHIRGRNRTKMNMRTTEIWRSSYCYVIVCTISSSSGVANHWTTAKVCNTQSTPKIFIVGQTYIVISRVRSLEGIQIREIGSTNSKKVL
ncbi:uncharacterized protein ACN427_004646 isoform 4-T7 [Glossina fuscipes fuscipes]